jgi:hypothetical protein
LYELKANNEFGYILPYALFICFLIFTLVTGVIYSLLLINNINIRKIEKKKLELACYSALQKEMNDKNNVPVKNKKIHINDIEVNIIHREKEVYREIPRLSRSQTVTEAKKNSLSFIA